MKWLLVFEPQGNELGSIDPILERQVETVRYLVASYMKIASKGIQDMVPKIVMFIVVNKVFILISNLLHPKILNINLYSSESQMY